MEFLVGKRLDAEIKRIAAERQARCAVAFWGWGAPRKFRHPKGLRIVCNLAQGATNPAVIADLQRRGATVRQHKTLHAKVYLGHAQAVVTSANASANGLALEGSEQAQWVEAGVLLQPTPSIEEWFEDIWGCSLTVTPRDLEKAQKLWAARRRERPQLDTFRDFDCHAETLPLVTWWLSGPPYRVDKQSVKQQVGYFNAAVEARIQNGLPVVGRVDRGAIPKNGTWILWWLKPKGRGPGRSVQTEWRYITPTIITKAGADQDKLDEKLDFALEAEHPPPAPFGEQDPKFRRALAEVLKRRKYAELTTEDCKGAWFTRARRSLIRRLWCDVHARYCEIASAR